jgi:ABC-2 type transport system permease protein
MNGFIHDQSYRRMDRKARSARPAWTVITRSGIRTLLAKRIFLALLLAAWVPFLVRAAQLYASANLPQAAFLTPTASTFRQYLRQQDIFVYLLTVYVGAGLIANDRRTNALQIYLSKPITRVDYLLGKLGILAVFLLGITWLPAVVLLALQVAFAGNFTFLGANLHLLPSITAFTLIEVSVAATTMLALSSLSTSARFAGILYTGLIFFSQAIFVVLAVATRDRRWSLLSLPNDVTQVGDWIFRLPLRGGPPWPASLVMVALLVVAAAAVLVRRVRGVDVVT